MFEVEVDTTKLNKVMAQFAKESRKSVDDILEKQTGILVGHMIALTPPGKASGFNMTDRGGIASSAKKKGEASVKADISSLFPTTRMAPEKVESMIESGYRWGTGRGAKKVGSYARSLADLERIHSRNRSKTTGRVKTGSIGQNMAMTRAVLRREFINKKKKNVGILNAGWLTAAKNLKTAKRATPAWITRHGSKPGGVNFRRSRHGLTITISNNMPYFPRNINSRMQKAVNRRANGIQKALVAMLERKAKKATQRMK